MCACRLSMMSVNLWIITANNKCENWLFSTIKWSNKAQYYRWCNEFDKINDELIWKWALLGLLACVRFAHKFYGAVWTVQNHRQSRMQWTQRLQTNLCKKKFHFDKHFFVLVYSAHKIYALDACNYALWDDGTRITAANTTDAAEKCTNVKHCALVIATHVCNLYASSITTSFVCSRRLKN